MSNKENKALLSGTEQQYIQDSSGFTGELARAGLFGVRNYTRITRASIANVRDVTSRDDAGFDEDSILLEMQQVISSAEEVGSVIGLLENTLIRFFHAGQHTRLISRPDTKGIEGVPRPGPAPDVAPSPGPDGLEDDDE